jgi:membrane associated rhomboid family serine protease
LYFLYVFGDNVEHLFGRRRFLLLYLGALLLGGVLQASLTRATGTPVIGASGAIAGVTAAYLWIFPRARLLQTIPFLYIQLKIPAWVYLGVWIGFQAVMAFFSDAVHFAWFAHLGGFLYGLAATPPRAPPAPQGGRRPGPLQVGRRDLRQAARASPPPGPAPRGQVPENRSLSTGP